MKYIDITTKACLKATPGSLDCFTPEVLADREDLENQLYDLFVNSDSVITSPYGDEAIKEDVMDNFEDVQTIVQYWGRKDEFNWQDLSPDDYGQLDAMARGYYLDTAIRNALNQLVADGDIVLG